MWHKFKAWWQIQWTKFKVWCNKNKAWIIAVFTAFGSGFALAFSINGKRNARIAKHIAELESRLSTYEDLNQRLADLSTELRARLESIEGNNDELRKQNAELMELSNYSRTNIERAREDISEARAAIGRSEYSAEQISAIADRLQRESSAVDSGIERLAEFLVRYGQESGVVQDTGN